MARALVTALADANSAEIIDDLRAKAGEIVAGRYEADFDAVYRRLENFPESGAPRPKLGDGIRVAVVFPYAVIYRFVADDDLVVVIRLLHGRRRITRAAFT